MFLKNWISCGRSAILLCAINAVATHQIARTSPTGRVNRPNNIANPPPSSTTTAKIQAASTIGRPCLTNIACVAAGPSSLVVPPMRNKRLSRTRPRSIIALSVLRIFRPLFGRGKPGHDSAVSFFSYHQHPNRHIVGCCAFGAALGRLASRQRPAGPGTQRADSLLEESVFKPLLPSHGAHSLRRENLNSQTGSTLRGVAQQLRAGRGRDFEDVKRHRDERVVADEPGKIHDALVAPTCAHPFVDVVA